MSGPSSKINKLCGAVIANKPVGSSSANMVNLLRSRLNMKKIGHTGILDRSASGLMLLLIGRATGLAQFFLNSDKEYIAEFHFGKSTDTHDREGNIEEEISPEEVRAFLKSRRSKIESLILDWVHLQEQLPPIYSALKQKGQRLSDYARACKKVEVQPRPIHIYESKILDYDEILGPRVYLHVSGGTYLRSLARDLGKELGIPTHLGALQRVAVGSHKLDEKTWEPDKNEPTILSVQETFRSWPVMIAASKPFAEKVSRGLPLPIQSLQGKAPSRLHQNFFIEDQSGAALAWAVRTSSGYSYRRIFL